MKRWLTLIGIVVVLIAVIGGIKAMQVKKMIDGYAAMPEPQATVSTAKAAYQEWPSTITAIGTLRAVRGVTLSAEVGGRVAAVGLRSGADVAAGERLLQLVADADIAKLRTLEANAELAALNAQRDALQFEAEAISRAALEASEANAKATAAAVAEQRALVDKLVIRAPFAGRLGISTINPGQYLAPGAEIVSVQQLDPIHADFNLPQQQLAQLRVGAAVTARFDSHTDTVFNGEITAIDASVDPETRNVRVQATLRNPERQLLPGLFGELSVATGAPQRYLTLPLTAIAFNPYGETVYVVVKRGEENAPDPNLPPELAKNRALDAADAARKAASAPAAESAAAPAPAATAGGEPVLVARQQFVVTGPRRGDQIAILSGLNEGDEVVTTGQLKLRNGARIAIDNAVLPAFDADPKPVDE